MIRTGWIMSWFIGSQFVIDGLPEPSTMNAIRASIAFMKHSCGPSANS
jgi:hypothetical protein